VQRVLILFLAFLPLLQAEECSWPQEWRAKALVRLDTLTSKAVPFASRSFSVLPSSYVLEHSNTAMEIFSEDYGYFSCHKPLVGIVTDSLQDIKVVEKILKDLIHEENLAFLKIAVGEILTKVLAYRNLQKGMVISIPTFQKDQVSLVKYEVVDVLDLWLEMPAFGLIPLEKGVPPIFLFRGTDLSLVSKGSWASILSDLDITGVGFSAFQLSQDKIHGWLVKAEKKAQQKPVVMGFSLGGVLSLYTAVFEGQFLSPYGSFAFNPPGVPEEVFLKWKGASSEQITTYVTQGDLVSKLGKIVPAAFLLSEKKHLGPIEAHTKLMTAEKIFFLSKIAIEEENKQRFTMD
jgi:hypothetical protein